MLASLNLQTCCSDLVKAVYYMYVHIYIYIHIYTVYIQLVSRRQTRLSLHPGSPRFLFCFDQIGTLKFVWLVLSLSLGERVGLSRLATMGDHLRR